MVSVIRCQTGQVVVLGRIRLNNSRQTRRDIRSGELSHICITQLPINGTLHNIMMEDSFKCGINIWIWKLLLGSSSWRGLKKWQWLVVDSDISETWGRSGTSIQQQGRAPARQSGTTQQHVGAAPLTTTSTASVQCCLFLAELDTDC